MPKDQVQMLITSQPDVSDIAGVLKDRLITLSVIKILQFLTECFNVSY